MGMYDDEQRRILANLDTYYENWASAQRELDGKYKGSMRWKLVKGRQYLYHRVSDSPLREKSLGPRFKGENVLPPEEADSDSGREQTPTERFLIEFLQGKSDATRRAQAASREAARFASLARVLKLATVPGTTAALLRHFDRLGMLGNTLLAVGTVAMPAYEIAAGRRLFDGFETTQDFDLSWQGWSASLQFHVGPGRNEMGQQPLGVLAALKRFSPRYTKNLERGFQATNGSFEVEVLAAPSTLDSYPNDDLVLLPGLTEQEWLLNGNPVRRVAVALDGTPAPIVAPDPRWMALHKLWLSQKAQRKAEKKPKDQAQGLLLMRALLWNLAEYPIDKEFVGSVPVELQGFLRTSIEWVLAHPYLAETDEPNATFADNETADPFLASIGGLPRFIDSSVLDLVRSLPLGRLDFPTATYPEIHQ